MTSLRAISSNLLVLVSALGFGSTLLPLAPNLFSRIDRIAVALLGGLGLLGTILFLLGQLRFSKSVIITVVLIGLAVGAAAIRKQFRVGMRMRLDRTTALPAVIVAVVLAITAVAGLARPSGDENNDAIMYHYVGPKTWLRDQVVRPLADNSLTAFPAIVEVDYAALMFFGGPGAPEVFAIISLSSLLIITAALARRFGLRKDDTLWVIAIVSTMPALYRGAYGGFIDCVYAAFVLIAARIAFESNTWKDYALLGVFCGFALGTKYTGLTAVPVMYSCILLANPAKQASRASLLKGLSIALAVSIAIGGPWYIRNWIMLGSPIYPPPSSVWLHFFHVRYLSAAAIEQLRSYVSTRGRGFGHGLYALAVLPFRLTFHTSNFHGAGGIGLIPLALGPLGLLKCRKNRFAQALALLAFFETLVWFYTDQESRFLIQVYVLSAVFGVAGWLHVTQLHTRYGRELCNLVLIISISYGLYMIASGRAVDLHAALSSSFAEQRLRTEESFAAGFDYINSNPSVSKVLILDPAAPEYYCDKDCFKPVGSWGETVVNASDINSVLAQLKALRVSHVADFKEKGRTFRLPPDPPDLTLVFERSDERIYRVDN